MFNTNRKRLCLTALVSLGVLVGTGCGSGNSNAVAPALDGNKDLAGLGTSAGVLTPAFDPAIHDYTVALFSPQASITVSPSVWPRAKVTIAGTEVASGQPSAALPLTALAAGAPVTIPITVTAEDQSSSAYTVKVNLVAANTDVWVLNSTNGSPVAGTVLQVADVAGNLLQGNIPIDANGHAKLGLPVGVKYTLLAQAPGSAQASLGNYDSSMEYVAKLYCHPLEMTAYPAVAPQITGISYSADGTTWVPVTGNAIKDNLAKIKKVKVTAIARCGVNATWTAGFGIGINVDRPAWAIFGDNFFIAPEAMVETSTPVSIKGLDYYQTTAVFPVSMVNFIANDNHYVDVVVYDVANNRTEQKVYVNPTDVTPNVATDKDLSTYTPALSSNFLTFGQSQDYFALQGNVSYNASLFFTIGTTSANAPAIRGFEVWRTTATDGTGFVKVATTQFASPTNTNNGTIGSYYWRDNDPATDLATTYTYKVRAFGANTSTATSNYTPFSAAIATKFMAPWTVSLAAPAQNAISTTRTPVFSFTNSNPALFNASAADQFRFFLYIKDKVGNAVYSQAYRYNWLYVPAGATVAAPRWEKRNGTSSTYLDASSEVKISADLSTISVQLPLTATVLLPGTTYEWSIFGTSNTSAASFLKYYPSPAGLTAASLSYGATSNQSNSAVNGYFTLIIDPSAK